MKFRKGLVASLVGAALLSTAAPLHAAENTAPLNPAAVRWKKH